MIPALATIVAVYAIARMVQVCIEFQSRNDDPRRPEGNTGWMRLTGLIAVTIIASSLILMQLFAIMEAGQHIGVNKEP